MYLIISILVLVVCVLLSLVVLVQNPKGGGLNQSLGGVSNQVFGAKRSTDLVEKVTWYLAAGIVVLTMLSAAFITRGEGGVAVPKSKAETIQEKGLLNNTNTFDANQPVFTMPAEETEN
jgi:preprotein translocase subunit SecG